MQAGNYATPSHRFDAAQPIPFNAMGVVSGQLNLDYGTAQHHSAIAIGNASIKLTGWPAAGYTGEMQVDLMNFGAVTTTWLDAISWVKADGTIAASFAASGYTLKTTGISFALFWTPDAGKTIYGVMK
jgi:hypothetical protein